MASDVVNHPCIMKPSRKPEETGPESSQADENLRSGENDAQRGHGSCVSLPQALSQASLPSAWS